MSIVLKPNKYNRTLVSPLVPVASKQGYLDIDPILALNTKRLTTPRTRLDDGYLASKTYVEGDPILKKNAARYKKAGGHIIDPDQENPEDSEESEESEESKATSSTHGSNQFESGDE